MGALAIHDRRVRLSLTGGAKAYDAGVTIFEEGEPARCAFIVRAGLVEISKAGWEGKAVLGYVGENEIFGEMALIDGQPRMATAVAVKPTVCTVVSAEAFRKKVLEADPLVTDILRILAQALRTVEENAVLKATPR
ncbi:MAG: cyclic nucleotide-binding domain-containing protein [Proteobacteria bacterium]|nr:cyclic nucleotide-binding domain-containing protein [Pseudomonadota bacterium]